VTAQITASQVKQLREATQAGMMDAKKALVETNGDFDAAVKLLREKGIAKAGKLGDRETTEGRVALAQDGDVAALVLLGCNTDFVAKNDDFGAFAQDVANHVLAHQPGNVEELLAQPWAKGGTVEDARAETSSSTGENVQIAKIARFDASGSGVLGTYLHGTGIGVIVDVAGPDTEDVRTFANDVAMHAAAASPQYLTRDEVPADAVQAEKEIYVKQLEGEGKPAEMLDKIATGKLNKWYSEIVLTEQTWIFGKDRIGKDVSIAEYAKLTGEKAGGDVAVRGFSRCSVKG
jgi:elongation factor Ts